MIQTCGDILGKRKENRKEEWLTLQNNNAKGGKEKIVKYKMINRNIKTQVTYPKESSIKEQCQEIENLISKHDMKNPNKKQLKINLREFHA